MIADILLWLSVFFLVFLLLFDNIFLLGDDLLYKFYLGYFKTGGIGLLLEDLLMLLLFFDDVILTG